jgi:hypothetical protein
MEIHPYHFLLLKYKINEKVKGHYLIPLCNDDCVQIGRPNAIDVSVGYLQKLLKPNCRLPERLIAHTLNELAEFINYKNWNGFLIKNKLSHEQYHRLMQSENRTELERYLVNRMNELLTVQLVIEFGE